MLTFTNFLLWYCFSLFFIPTAQDLGSLQVRNHFFSLPTSKIHCLDFFREFLLQVIAYFRQ